MVSRDSGRARTGLSRAGGLPIKTAGSMGPVASVVVAHHLVQLTRQCARGRPLNGHRKRNKSQRGRALHWRPIIFLSKGDPIRSQL